jgi:hypothetical protein
MLEWQSNATLDMAQCVLKLPFQYGLLKLLPDEEEVDGEQDSRE